jgi:thiol-disulfide isomerase/thioredoxin
MKHIELKVFLILFLIIFLIINNTNLLHTDSDSSHQKVNQLNEVLTEEINKIRNDTRHKIRKVEEEVLEEESISINPNGGPNLTVVDEEGTGNDYLNNDEVGINDLDGNNSSKQNLRELEPFSNQGNNTLYLFYTMSCPHSQAILPIWYRVRNVLPRNTTYKEVDCAKLENKGICNAFKISGVPTIFLVKKENSNVYRLEYTGDNTFNNISNFLRNNNVVLNAFEDTGNHQSEKLNVENFQNIIEVPDTSIEDRLQRNQEAECPEISYDKNMDRSQDKYYFQLFNPNGQYGYSKGGVGEPLDKYHAAYNAVDTYLSTLPDPELIGVCANKNKKMIREFELCDEKKLDEILSYPRLVETGKANERMDNINYNNNFRVVNAIKDACSIKNN